MEPLLITVTVYNYETCIPSLFGSEIYDRFGGERGTIN